MYCLSPGIISTLVTLALLYTMISLGFWQLGRAEFKDTLQQKIEERKNMSVSGLDELAVTVEDRRYMPVGFTGEYDNEHSFLLDNKILNGRVGYHVYTPVLLAENKAILVARGFIAMGKTRDQLPEIDTPAGFARFEGLLDQPPSRALVLAEYKQQSENWPVVLQYIDLDQISDMLGYELYDMIMWLNEDPEQINGLFTYDLPVLNLNAAKNNGYAFQWFAMSLALSVIYIFVNIKRKN
jgi:surfeit locus 1 family protein